MTKGSAPTHFGKYERFGAYHWREVGLLPTRHNAILTARYRVLLNALDPKARRILDIGCGDGTLTFKLAQGSDLVCGIDDALLPLRLARRELGRHRMAREPLLSSADARRLPFADETFDCVVLADVIEHIDTPDIVISEARRVLRRGGQILLTTPKRQDADPGHEYHCREYTAVELRELLSTWFSGVAVQVFRPAAMTRLYDRKVFGRKLFRIAVNCCAIAGWNPLARTASFAAEATYNDLCGSGRKT